MITGIFSRIWKRLPPRVRTAIVRSTQQTFTVSVAAVVTNDAGKLLLLDHVIRPRSGWGIPGGFVAAGEQPGDAIRREVREETGLELTDIALYRVRTLKRHFEVIYTARTSGAGEVLSREISRLEWFEPGNVPAEMNRDQRELVKDLFPE